MGTSSFLTMTKCFADSASADAEKNEVVNRRDRRVAIYSSRGACAAAAKGGKHEAECGFLKKEALPLF